MIAPLTHLSGNAFASSLTAQGALDPPVILVESGLVTLGVLFRNLRAAGLDARLREGAVPRLWEAGVLCSPLLPPLVIGLLVVFRLPCYC